MTKASPKDLAFSTAWFIGSFINNVTRERHTIELVEAHPVNMETYPDKQEIMINWRAEGGTAGLTIQFTNVGSVSVKQWFGTNEVLKQQLKNLWNQCKQQIDKTWERMRPK